MEPGLETKGSAVLPGGRAQRILPFDPSYWLTPSFPIKLAHYLVRSYWHARYTWNSRRLFTRLDSVPIDRPIFLVGTQGAGLTLTSRILRRQPRVVSISGNHRNWAGSDEMHNAHHIGPLPRQLRLYRPGFSKLKGDNYDHPIFGLERSWVYATDEMLDEYRLAADDSSGASGHILKQTIQRALVAYAMDISTARFIDKSQTYSLKIPFLVSALRGCSPKFVIVMRNPFAQCWREVDGRRRKYAHFRQALGDEMKVRYAAEHWENTYRIALTDARGYGDYLAIRFEDLLTDPVRVARKLFAYCELDFSEEFVPGPRQRLPWGSAAAEKWYPLRTNVNDPYLAGIPSFAVDLIRQRCGRLAEQFGYAAP